MTARGVIADNAALTDAAFVTSTSERPSGATSAPIDVVNAHPSCPAAPMMAIVISKASSRNANRLLQRCIVLTARIEREQSSILSARALPYNECTHARRLVTRPANIRHER